MKKITLIVLICAALFILAGCGMPDAGLSAAKVDVRASYTLKKGEVKKHYTSEDFLALYKTYVNPAADMVEVTELSVGLIPEVTFVSAHENISRQTPLLASWERAGCQVFKALDSFSTYVLREGRMFEIGTGFGGMGVESVESLSLTGDKTTPDTLLFTYSWGSGIHRSAVGYYDFRTHAEYAFPVSYPNADCTLRRDDSLKQFELYATYPLTPYGYDEEGLTPIGTVSLRGKTLTLETRDR